ncbi:hypothetical protein H4219_004218 [Mycoemilia scoparia]|uniref:Peptidase M50B-like protein n=1 Tax=Mycoemilia scoparia TaxID=417184 RepID=A0A9W8DRR8_9FUNG|nr:hypothetical protein H4219_004218 [Mycoemilia scoparia]
MAPTPTQILTSSLMVAVRGLLFEQDSNGNGFGEPNFFKRQQDTSSNDQQNTSIKSRLTPTKDQKITLGIAVGYFFAILILWHIPYVKEILKPFKLVTVALHEFGHAITCLLTCGKVEGIEINPDEGGVTRMRGGVEWCTLPAGYLGSSLIGAVMVFAGFNILASKIVSVFLAVCLVAILYWAGNWLTRILTVLFVGLIIGLWFTPKGVGLKYFVLFMGVMSCMYSLWDIIDDLVLRKVNSSDATRFAKKLHCSAHLCGVFWFLISAVFFAAAIILGIVAFKDDGSNS